MATDHEVLGSIPGSGQKNTILAFLSGFFVVYLPTARWVYLVWKLAFVEKGESVSSAPSLSPSMTSELSFQRIMGEKK